MNYCPNCGHKLDGAKYTICPECSQRLRFPPDPLEITGSEIIKCARCDGTGEVKDPGFLFTYITICPVCGGTGVNRV
jgi:DnaJ-class molecular chaperone